MSYTMCRHARVCSWSILFKPSVDGTHSTAGGVERGGGPQAGLFSRNLPGLGLQWTPLYTFDVAQFTERRFFKSLG